MLLFVMSALAACDGETTRQVMAIQPPTGELAFQRADPRGVLVAAGVMREAIPCAGERLLPSEVAAAHRLFAFEAFLERDLAAVELWFSASKAIEPDYELPVSVVPAKHPLRAIYEAASPSKERVRIRAYRSVTTWIDGVPNDSAPLGRPYLLQWADTNGWVQTVLYAAGELPEAPTQQGTRGPLFSVAGGVTAVAWDGGVQAYGGPSLRLHLPIAGPLYAAFDGMLPISGVPSGDAQGVYMLPAGCAGLALRGRSATALWGSVGALVVSDEAGLRPGAGGALGIDVSTKSATLTPEIRMGWAGVSMVGAALGVRFGG